MSDDITATLAPKSDQLDAVDLMGQPPQVFTITKVDVKDNPNAEQPVSVHLAEFPRVWRPGLSMRRVLGYCWGNKASAWVGHLVELYCDETVTFGNDVTGGTRISRLSHIDGTKKIPLLVKRGKSATFVVEPLTESDIKLHVLRTEWHTADADRRKAIEAEVSALQKGATK